MGYSITVIIIIINYVLTTSTVILVRCIGYETRSQEQAVIMKTVFVGYFFNTGVIVLLIHLNLSEHYPTQFWSLFNGSFTDYMPEWYLQVGRYIVQQFLVQIVMPWLYLLIAIYWNKVKMWLDIGCCNKGDLRKTRLTNMLAFLDYYQDPEFEISYYYSEVLNITYLAMFYGIGMPILIPLAAFILWN
jgi:hypothetical protein